MDVVYWLCVFFLVIIFISCFCGIIFFIVIIFVFSRVFDLLVEFDWYFFDNRDWDFNFF